MTISYFDTPEVEITSLYFRNNPAEQRMEGYPKKMLYAGREYTFVESGMRYLIERGQELIKLFDVTDGQNQYRLRLDTSNRWTLIDTKKAF